MDVAEYTDQMRSILPFIFCSVKTNKNTAQKLKLSVEDFFSKCEQIHRKKTLTKKHLNGKSNFLSKDT